MDQDPGHALRSPSTRVAQELHGLVVQLGGQTSVADRRRARSLGPTQGRLVLQHRPEPVGKAILELFAERWPLEVAFYNAKQFLGLEEPQNRTPQAVQRTAPIALYLHTLVILWFAKHGRFNAEAYRRLHPWYTQKRTPSFADMLANLKRASLRESISRYPGQKPPSAKRLRILFQASEIAA